MDSTIGRRDFVKLAGGATLALGFAQAPTAPGPDAAERDLVLLALDAAKSAGASYADARITHGLFEAVGTRERQITNVTQDRDLRHRRARAGWRLVGICRDPRSQQGRHRPHRTRSGNHCRVQRQGRARSNDGWRRSRE